MPPKKPAAKPKPVMPPKKQSPIAKFGTWLINTVGGAITSGGAVVALVIGLWALDDRYAHAADIGKQIEANRLSAEISSKENRKDYLTDKVYDLAAKKTQQKKLPVNEEVSFQRYSAELNAVAAEIAAKQRQLERVKTGK